MGAAVARGALPRRHHFNNHTLFSDSEVVDGVPEGTSDGSARLGIQDVFELS